MKAFETEIEHRRYHGLDRATFEAATIRWGAEFLPSKKPETAKRYLVSKRRLERAFGDLYLDQITRRQIADYISARKKEKVTNATIRRDLTALSRILGCAVAWGWLDINPARDFDRSIVAERRGPIALPSERDIGAFVGTLPDGFARVVRFLQRTGMRQAEALTLEWRDVNGSQATLTRTKTSRARVVNLSDEALGTILGAPRHISSPYVFWTEGRHGVGPFSNFASRFKGYMTRWVERERKAGSTVHPFRCHDLRHWYAVNELRNGRDIYDLSRHLGHSSVKTTEIYLDYVGRESEAPRGRETG